MNERQIKNLKKILGRAGFCQIANDADLSDEYYVRLSYSDHQYIEANIEFKRITINIVGYYEEGCYFANTNLSYEEECNLHIKEKFKKDVEWFKKMKKKYWKGYSIVVEAVDMGVVDGEDLRSKVF